ncbi:uncharacterized protein BDR25DRAFT_132484 [Lindgomyces ingoldianus]|uniref:Uncharacterized protein n=1 Tax=Lindgomyces ingoldianus TaxID=673940 RepID=A0ACB6R3T0_9PLEO|nr:uncharacterized protein BDR25DRAFT_132484 [Lindgomyces ingoldianus]KAF2473483.1 hypothetical protein BDR25DRAFT_132484 [Lindgomyces ingoldianus]
MAPSTTKAGAAKAKAVNGAGVKKSAGPKSGKKVNARNAMAKMQAYFKEHRAEFKDLSFKDQQKELGKMWKTAPENPKTQTA